MSVPGEPRKLTASKQYKRVYLLDDENNMVASLGYFEDAKWIAAAVNEALGLRARVKRLEDMVEIERETQRNLAATLGEIKRLANVDRAATKAPQERSE